MTTEIFIKRYAAFYRGWCQAFGEHEGEVQEDADINWIYGEEAIGLILSRTLQKRFMRHLLRGRHEHTDLWLRRECLCMGQERVVLASEADRDGLSRIHTLFDSGQDIHMYLTSHFYYPAGTRIITFSTHRPLPILYKEIKPVQIRLED